MQSDPIIANPIGWVHAQLAGGWRKAGMLGAVYFCGAVGLLMLFHRASGAGRTRGSLFEFTQVALTILSVLQGVVAVIVTSSSIGKAVQRDFASGMIDSHRLTPVPGWAAVLGYLTGPAINLIPITLANVLLTTGLAAIGGHDLFVWPMGMLLSLCVGFTMGSINLLLNLCSRKGSGIMGLLVVLSTFGMYPLLMLFPAIGFVIGFFFVARMISMSTGRFTFDPGIVYALGCQFIIALICCHGASRKYLRADVQAFPWPMGLFILTFAALQARLGLVLFGDYANQTPMFRHDQPDLTFQWVGSLAALAIFSFLPITAVFKSHVRWQRHRTFDPDNAGPRPAPAAIILLATVAIPAVFIFLSIGDGRLSIAAVDSRNEILLTGRIALVMGVFALALLPVAGLADYVYRIRERAGWYIAFWVVLTWIVPPALDVARMIAFSQTDNFAPSWLMGFSPAGAWALIFNPAGVSLMPGLAFQAAMAALMLIGIPMLRRRRTIHARPVVN